jgi:hypothetical protein
MDVTLFIMKDVVLSLKPLVKEVINMNITIVSGIIATCKGVVFIQRSSANVKRDHVNYVFTIK